jgi:hypothetical protein
MSRVARGRIRGAGCEWRLTATSGALARPIGPGVAELASRTRVGVGWLGSEPEGLRRLTLGSPAVGGQEPVSRQDVRPDRRPSGAPSSATSSPTGTGPVRSPRPHRPWAPTPWPPMHLMVCMFRMFQKSDAPVEIAAHGRRQRIRGFGPAKRPAISRTQRRHHAPRPIGSTHPPAAHAAHVAHVSHVSETMRMGSNAVAWAPAKRSGVLRRHAGGPGG